MSLNQIQLLALLEEVLGRYKLMKKHNEAAFFCPSHQSDKMKLQVNLSTGHWHCWVCQLENHMKGKSIFTLFRRVNATREQFARLSEIIGEYSPISDTDEVEVIKSLPKEFKSLAKMWDSSHYKHAFHYVMNRGITFDDILKYNIGYAERGDYNGKIIIPSYGADGRLNFFVGRAFYHDDWRQHQMPEWSKDEIVGFEAFINWKMPIVLVEGAFDAIAVKINAIPLFGKTVSATLHQRIIENRVSDIYVALDRDAIRNSARYIELFLGEGRTVYFVELQDKDPSKIGFEKMQDIIHSTRKATFADVMKLRLA